MIKLDDRLAAVAALVRPGSRVADVGTDHAYLPVWLVENGICPSAIASDIGEGPLDSARHTVTAAYLTDRISLRLGDGLSRIEAAEVEDIVIAGMGGETIAAILDAAPFVQDRRLRLILQPMTRGEELRCWLLTHGFAVREEHLIRDKHHLYPVMAAEYTAAAPAEDVLSYYAGFFAPEEGRPYRQMMAQHLHRRAQGLAHAGDNAGYERLSTLAKQLEQM